MLTITETIDAIRAIDTDPAVLHNAMNKILNIDQNQEDFTATTLAQDIVKTYRPKAKDSHMLVDALATATAVVCTLSARKGHEIRALEHLNGLIQERYITTTKILFMERIAENPAEGLKDLLGLMKEISTLADRG